MSRRWVRKGFAETIKQWGKRLFEPKEGGSYKVFQDRPLRDEILIYAAHDSRYMRVLYECYRELWHVLEKLAYQDQWKRWVQYHSHERGLWYRHQDYVRPSAEAPDEQVLLDSFRTVNVFQSPDECLVSGDDVLAYLKAMRDHFGSKKIAWWDDYYKLENITHNITKWNCTDMEVEYYQQMTLCEQKQEKLEQIASVGRTNESCTTMPACFEGKWATYLTEVESANTTDLKYEYRAIKRILCLVDAFTADDLEAKIEECMNLRYSATAVKSPCVDHHASVEKPAYITPEICHTGPHGNSRSPIAVSICGSNPANDFFSRRSWNTVSAFPCTQRHSILAQTMTVNTEISHALSTIQDVLGNLRRLQTTDLSGCPDVGKARVDLEDAHNIAQIIQGAAFIFLAMWLIFANNSKVAVAQKAPLEQRHAAIDDFDLPGRENNFSLNLSRPIEWIATCPIMQLKLVVLAGARVPSYRRFMMPLLSVAVLLCGTASMFTGDALRYGWYGRPALFTGPARARLIPNAFMGDSDFRKLSLLLILTWFPFPIWFSLSIEGFGVITDYLVIEMGWVALNIISKFTFIILMQRMKMLHQRKLEAARELYGLSPTESWPTGKMRRDEIGEDELKQKNNGHVKSAAGGVAASAYGLGFGEEAESEEKMVEVVAETMVTLGMNLDEPAVPDAGEHPRAISHMVGPGRWFHVSVGPPDRLMVENGVTNTAVLERLNGERCMELNLPYVLIEACQKRWTSEKMNLGQENRSIMFYDQGGLIEKEDPFMKLLEANKDRMTNVSGKTTNNLMAALPGIPATEQPSRMMPGMMMTEDMEHVFTSMMHQVLLPFQEKLRNDEHHRSARTRFHHTHAPVPENELYSRALPMDFSQVAILQTVNACQVLLHKLDSSQDSVVQKVDTQKIAVDNLLNSITGATDNTKQDGSAACVATPNSALMETVNSSSSVLLQKLDVTQQDLLKQSKDSHELLEGVATKQTALVKQVDSGHEFTRKRLVEMEGTLERRITDSSDELRKDQQEKSEKLTTNVQGALKSLAEQCNAMAETTERATATQEERMVDVRRQTMLIMDLVSNTQDSIQQSANSLESFTRSEYMQHSSANLEMNLREVIVKQLSEVKESLLGVNGGTDTNLKSAIAAMVERLDEGVHRLELASSQGQGATSDAELLRQELLGVAEVLSQQQQDVSSQNLQQVGELLRTELSSFKETQEAQSTEISTKLSEKVSEFSDQANLDTGKEKEKEWRKRGLQIIRSRYLISMAPTSVRVTAILHPDHKNFNETEYAAKGIAASRCLASCCTVDWYSWTLHGNVFVPNEHIMIDQDQHAPPAWPQPRPPAKPWAQCSASVFMMPTAMESPVVLVSAPGLDLNQVEESSVGSCIYHMELGSGTTTTTTIAEQCTWQINVSRSDQGIDKLWVTYDIEHQRFDEAFRFSGCDAVELPEGKHCVAEGKPNGIRILKNRWGHGLATGSCCDSTTNKVISAKRLQCDGYLDRRRMRNSCGTLL
eukprot:g13762.t1